MFANSVLNRLGELMLKDAVKAFEDKYGYIPSKPDRIEYQSYDIRNINGEDIYIFEYSEYTKHDCPYGIGIELSEYEVMDLLDIANIKHNHKPCKFCKSYNGIKDGNYVQIGDLYMDHYGIYHDGDMSRWYADVEINFCPECGRKL